MLRGGRDPYWKRKAKTIVESRAKAGPLYDKKAVDRAKRGIRQWQDTVYREWTARLPEELRDHQIV